MRNTSGYLLGVPTTRLRRPALIVLVVLAAVVTALAPTTRHAAFRAAVPQPATA